MVRVDETAHTIIDLQMSALKELCDRVRNGKLATLTIPAAINPIDLSLEAITEIDDDFGKFEEYLDRIQQIDVYYATASLAANDGMVTGVFILTSSNPTALPLKPERSLYINKSQVDRWIIGFYSLADDEMLGYMPYQDFLNNVSTAERYDANRFIIELSQAEMEDLLNAFRIEL